MTAGNGTKPHEGGILAGLGPLENPLPLLLVQATVILTVCRVLGLGLQRIKEPRVIAEVIGGILLGPSALGKIPGFSQTLFPPASLPNLSLIANFGLVFYMLLIGMELDTSLVRDKARQSILISVAGMAIPFGCSSAVSYLIFTSMSEGHNQADFGQFLLFLGVAMSITALPVLARILGELRLFHTPVGIQTISAAVIDDAMAWVFLAVVIAIVNASSPLNALGVFGMAAAFALIMLIPVRMVLARLFERGSRENGTIAEWVVVVVLILTMFSAFLTDMIGVHAIFGGFLSGLAVPRQQGFTIALTEKIEDFVSILLLPLFFAYSGLRTNIGLLADAKAWGIVFLVIFTACIGKILGCALMARFLKMPWRDSWAIGVLMNTKGLVELIVLNIGYDAGIINSEIFTALVIMAVVTTLMTTPLVSFIYPPSYYKTTIAETTSMELQPASSSHEKLDDTNIVSANSIRPLICIPGLRFVPTMMNLIHMIDSGSENERKSSIHAVRMVEASERFSGLIKATHVDMLLDTDPVLNVFKTFGTLNKMAIKPHVAVATMNEFPTELSELAEEFFLNMILIPWQHPAEVSQHFDYTTNHNEHHQIVRSLIKMQRPVAVIFDRNIVGERCRILVPFFGGEDDRQAVLLALKLGGHPNTTITIRRILTENEPSPVPSKDRTDAELPVIEQKTGSQESLVDRQQESVPSPVPDEVNEKFLDQIRKIASTAASHPSLPGVQITYDEKRLVDNGENAASRTILNSITSEEPYTFIIVGFAAYIHPISEEDKQDRPHHGHQDTVHSVIGWLRGNSTGSTMSASQTGHTIPRLQHSQTSTSIARSELFNNPGSERTTSTPMGVAENARDTSHVSSSTVSVLGPVGEYLWRHNVSSSLIAVRASVISK